MKAREILGLAAIDSERGDALGSVKGFIIDLGKRSIVAL